MPLSDLSADTPFGQGAGPGRATSSKAARYESQARRVGEHTATGRELMAKAAKIRVSRPNVVSQEYLAFEKLGQDLAEMGKSGEIGPEAFADLKASHFNAVSRSGLKPRHKSYLFDFTDELDEIELNLDKAFGRKIKRKTDKLGIKEKKQGLERGKQIHALGKHDLWKARISKKEFEQVQADKDKAEKTLFPKLLDNLGELPPLADVADEDRGSATQARTKTIIDFLLQNPELYHSPKSMASIKSKLQDLGYDTDRIEARERETRTQNAQNRAAALRLGIEPKDATPTEKKIAKKVTDVEETAARVKAADRKLSIDKELYDVNIGKIKVALGQLDAVTKDVDSYELPIDAANVIKSYKDSLEFLAGSIKDAAKKKALSDSIKKISHDKNDYEGEDDEGGTGRTEPSTFKASLSTLRSHLASLHGILGDEYAEGLVKARDIAPTKTEEDEEDPGDIEEAMKPGKPSAPAPSPQIKVGDIVIWADSSGSGNYRIFKVHPDGSFDLEPEYYTEDYKAEQLKDDPDWKPTQFLNEKPGPKNLITKHPFLNE